MKVLHPSKTRRKALWVSTWIAISSMVLAGQGTAPATTDPIMKALADELNRSVVELRLNNLDKPYFIQYIVLDEDEFEARATFGALTQAPTRTNSRPARLSGLSRRQRR
jgi:hypothetical protein